MDRMEYNMSVSGGPDAQAYACWLLHILGGGARKIKGIRGSLGEAWRNGGSVSC